MLGVGRVGVIKVDVAGTRVGGVTIQHEAVGVVGDRQLRLPTQERQQRKRQLRIAGESLLRTKKDLGAPRSASRSF